MNTRSSPYRIRMMSPPPSSACMSAMSSRAIGETSSALECGPENEITYPRQYPRTYPRYQHARSSWTRDESHPRMITHQSSGCSLMNVRISCSHSAFWRLTTSTPLERRYSSPPTKVVFSPITTRQTLYRIHAPVHMSHGDRVVYIVAPLYEDAGSRPACSRADISACGSARSDIVVLMSGCIYSNVERRYM